MSVDLAGEPGGIVSIADCPRGNRVASADVTSVNAQLASLVVPVTAEAMSIPVCGMSL